jgi:hypothetical protein
MNNKIPHPDDYKPKKEGTFSKISTVLLGVFMMIGSFVVYIDLLEFEKVGGIKKVNAVEALLYNSFGATGTFIVFFLFSTFLLWASIKNMRNQD